MSEILMNLQEELDAYDDDAVVKNKSRMIINDGKYIYIYLCESGAIEYATYSPELYHFLTRPSRCSYSYDYNKERSQVELMQFPQIVGKRYKPRLSSFLYQWYINNDHTESFFKKLPNVTCSTEVDHANGDKHNHCVWNLLGVESSKNREKYDYSLRVKPPYYLYIAVTPEKDYRIEYGFENEFRHGQTLYLFCRNIDDLTALLQSIMAIDTAPIWMRHNGTPRQIYNAHPKEICACEDFHVAAHKAELLLAADPTLFTTYTQDNNIVVHGGLLYITDKENIA